MISLEELMKDGHTQLVMLCYCKSTGMSELHGVLKRRPVPYSGLTEARNDNDDSLKYILMTLDFLVHIILFFFFFLPKIKGMPFI